MIFYDLRYTKCQPKLAFQRLSHPSFSENATINIIIKDYIKLITNLKFTCASNVMGRIGGSRVQHEAVQILSNVVDPGSFKNLITDEKHFQLGI